jgi:hypothetical protein
MRKFVSLLTTFALVANLVGGAALAAGTTDNTYSIGNGAASDKKLIFNKGSGSGNPVIKWNNSESQLQFAIDGSSWKNFGSGSGGGGFNYLTNSDGDSNTTGWTTGADAAASRPVDGTGGTATSDFTWTRTTSNPIRGNGSFLLSHPASNSQGSYASTNFTIARADMGKVLTIRANVELVSGTYDGGTSSTDSDLIAYIYDRDGSTLIEPSNFRIETGVAGQGVEFVSSFASSSTSDDYRLIIYSAKTTATAFVVKFDDFSVGPQAYATGAPVTDWVTYTPTLNSTSNVTSIGFWRRVGDSMEGLVTASWTGAGHNSNFTISLPGNYTIDSNKITSTSVTRDALGSGKWEDAGTGSYFGHVSYESATSLNIIGFNNANNRFNSSSAANGDKVAIRFFVPITGWGSTVTMASAEAQRPVNARLYKATTQAMSSTALTKIAIDSAQVDSHGGLDAGNNRWVSPISAQCTIGGFMSFNLFTAGEVHEGNITINGINVVRQTNSAGGTSGSLVFANTAVNLKAGDYVEMWFDSVTDSSFNVLGDVYTQLSISCNNGGAQLAANEPVHARYTSSSSTSIANASNTIVDFATKIIDTHNAVTTGAAWKFTAPSQGVYLLCSKVISAVSGGWAAGEQWVGIALKNGANASGIGDAVAQATHGTNMSFNGCKQFKLVQGDYLQVAVYQSSGASLNTLSGSHADVWIDITRISP